MEQTDTETSAERNEATKKQSDGGLTGQTAMAARVIAWMIALGLICVGLCVPVYQSYGWLRTGTWTPLKAEVITSPLLGDSVRVSLERESDSWVGLRRLLVRYLYDCPLTWFLILTGFVFFLVLVRLI